MTNLELSLLMGLAPIIYFIIFTRMDRKIVPGQRVVTNILRREGKVMTVTPTHSFIEFDDGLRDWCRNEILED
jgi:hypothetical protein